MKIRLLGGFGQMFNNVFRNKKVLITGDTGFKGSWLCIWLNSLGAEIYGYSLPPISSNDNFVVSGLYDVIKHHDGDVRDFNKLYNYIKEIKPDFAFHLAAQPIVIEAYKNPKYTFETNIIGTLNFLESIRLTDSVKVALVITSDKCYKNNEWIWGYRENDPLGGKDPYSSSKAAAELIVEAYINSYFQKEDTCNVASVRAGNVIGGGDWSPYRIVPDFFRAYFNGTSLVIRNPQSIRPWQFILEPLSGYLNLAERLFNVGKIFQGAWNFGPNQSNHKTVKTLVEKLIENINSNSPHIIFEKTDYQEAKMLALDISKANYYLNWEPILNFDQTVSFTVEGYTLEGNSNFLFERIKQIELYCELAKQKKIIWAIL
ncbi:MAG: CDP-glucose 4,6-dehydratase [Ignavibacteria bacterium]|jgi:CDP-glucose 4,6-dehydratase|nr:CDP-glucose 4,6-dehydratase [Ignavibacteria bacterium]MDH7527489.1 CDP-glucose 4,6-dehydratase [Ignavibacteria bacterium]